MTAARPQPRRLAILGCRGVPARHGGFETFAERFALHLAAGGCHVRVYCQGEGRSAPRVDRWHGVERVTIGVDDPGPWGTIVFDWLSLRHACRERFPLLTLGYNTAAFAALSRAAGCRNVMNMDGIEWKRQKWSLPVRAWFYANEKLGCWLANHLVADHPGIADHLAPWAGRRRITVIPYGADRIDGADAAPLARWNLAPGSYGLVVARPEPENSIVEMVRAFGAAGGRRQLVVLGNYRPEGTAYQRAVLAAADARVVFPGAIYDTTVVTALRVHARVYLHGHRVGGTNPSLVEALGCGSPVIAHDNRFNRWVAGEGARYFRDEDACATTLASVLEDDRALDAMRVAARERHAQAFQWSEVLARYEALCVPNGGQ